MLEMCVMVDHVYADFVDIMEYVLIYPKDNDLGNGLGNRGGTRFGYA